MLEKSDGQLLRDYALHGVESAFAELVARHANLVFSAAARQADSPDSAADVSQRVFIALAQSAVKLAARIPADASLAGWLCRTARNISCQTRRHQLRQETRALQAMELLASPTSNHTSLFRWMTTFSNTTKCFTLATSRTPPKARQTRHSLRRSHPACLT